MKPSRRGQYTWADWWDEHGPVVFVVGTMVAGMLLIGFVNGWK